MSHKRQMSLFNFSHSLAKSRSRTCRAGPLARLEAGPRSFRNIPAASELAMQAGTAQNQGSCYCGLKGFLGARSALLRHGPCTETAAYSRSSQARHAKPSAIGFHVATSRHSLGGAPANHQSAA